jgi:hypothetical protein
VIVKARSRCPCGCPLDVKEGRYYATDQCASRERKRRERSKNPSAVEVHVCEICEKPLLRKPNERRRLYHDECKPEAQKILRVLRGK